MSSQIDEGQSPMAGVNPLAFIVPVVILVVVVTLVARRRNTGVAARAGDGAGKAARRGRSSTRRMMVGVLINALENDLARRALIMGLKVARSRM